MSGPCERNAAEPGREPGSAREKVREPGSDGVPGPASPGETCAPDQHRKGRADRRALNAAAALALIAFIALLPFIIYDLGASGGAQGLDGGSGPGPNILFLLLIGAFVLAVILFDRFASSRSQKGSGQGQGGVR